MPHPDPRLIVALDLPNVGDARAMVERLGPTVGFYKIGLELAFSGGLDLARALIDQGKDVFLDLKLHDIPNTVTRATAQVAKIGARFLTVHAYPQTMRAALDGLGDSDLKVLGVSVLTSSSDSDLRQAGYALSASDLVLRRARQARDIGLPGLILSPLEVAAVRSAVGPTMLLVTPEATPRMESNARRTGKRSHADGMILRAASRLNGSAVTAAMVVPSSAMDRVSPRADR